MLVFENYPSGLTYSRSSDSWRVRAVKPVEYEVRVCNGVFDPASTALIEQTAGAEGGNRRFVVIDAEVDRLHGERIRRYFEHHGVDYFLQVVRADETLKEFETASDIVVALDSFGLDRRREPIIVIGGGVLMDIVCLVANLYRRGTPVVRVPTTLIGLVDAGVGVKTGVNFNGHKNRLGTYFAPVLTLLDRSFLATVDRRHIANGMGEILKMALIKDARLFELLEQHGPALIERKFQDDALGGDPAGEVLRRAIHGMLEELQPNLWEAELERIVDYGHTFSPTLEMRALPALLHGEAVTVDMALTTLIGWRRGLVDLEQRDRILAVMRALELPSWNELLDADLLDAALQDTVRHRDGQQRLPLPAGIGDAVFVNDVTRDELAVAVEDLRVLNARELSRV
ncbi:MULTISPECIES: sedoheptulose 7-phosphate cyclase [unclassified Kitasatospora]|uniref:sedoheptulose 7-phosphate cyclase n=1 Tax=unclassified Kitasatospora TaxID=2633591 RepID=UPI0033B58770